MIDHRRCPSPTARRSWGTTTTGSGSTFDTFGDGQPGGELIEEELIFESGHHPGLDVEFCPLLEELIG